MISLCYEEYSPYLKGRIVKSDTVNSLTINTRSVKKYPYSFSIPPMYPPTIQTQQGRIDVGVSFVVSIAWKLHFSFFFNPKWNSQEPPEKTVAYTFDPEEYLNQKLTKVDWTYDITVLSCLNERFGETLGVREEMEGREENMTISYVCNKQASPPQSNRCSQVEQPEGLKLYRLAFATRSISSFFLIA